MKVFNLKGEVRTEVGKKATKALRKQDMVPCNLYGEKKDENGKNVAIPFAVKREDVRKLVYTPDIYVINLTLGDETLMTVMKELQFHPLSDALLHMDFYHINEKKPIVMDVPLKFEGLAEGVKAGGRLNASVRTLKVRAPYTDIREKIVVDVTGVALGKSVKAGELDLNGLELATSKELVVCSVKMVRGALADAEEATDEAAAETPADGAAAAPAADGDAKKEEKK
jgi:large subunit ribosomal protein L25